MKLDPVFLVSPKPNPSAMPTRRAFLIAGSTFTLGTAVGGACGYSIGVSTQGQPDAGDDYEPSGDVELDELRRLAVKAPLEELYAKRINFTLDVAIDYRRDAILWRGVDRLGNAVLADESLQDRRMSAKLVAQIIELAEPTFRERYVPLAKQLRSLR